MKSENGLAMGYAEQAGAHERLLEEHAAYKAALEEILDSLPDGDPRQIRGGVLKAIVFQIKEIVERVLRESGGSK